MITNEFLTRKPGNRERFWLVMYIDHSAGFGDVSEQTWYNTKGNNSWLEQGRCFSSKEGAQEAINTKRKELEELEKKSRSLC